MTYEEAIAYIESEKWQNHKPGLSRTRALLAALGNPERGLKFIHIAGTNGKGSTAAMLASVLEAAGYKTGLFTSPYVYEFEERIQINRVNIGKDELAHIVSVIAPAADALEDTPTEFEILTAAGMLYFAGQKCDIVVLEAGMGGEFDSTNVIPVPEVAVITAIGLDHTEYLGDTIEKIAKTKAGIIKEGGDVVFYGRNPEAEAVIRSVCEEKHARLCIPDYDTLNPVISDFDGQMFDYRGFDNIRLPLLGAYQLDNAAVALTAIRLLNRKDGSWFIRDEDIRKGLANTVWKGRLEVINRVPLVIVDGSHNPQGIKATADSLTALLEGSKMTFLIGASADKDVEKGAAILAPIADGFITVTHGNIYRAMDAKRIAEIIESVCNVPVTAADSIDEGCRMALAAAKKTAGVCAIGSLFQIADITAKMKELL